MFKTLFSDQRSPTITDDYQRSSAFTQRSSGAIPATTDDYQRFLKRSLVHSRIQQALSSGWATTWIWSQKVSVCFRTAQYHTILIRDLEWNKHTLHLVHAHETPVFFGLASFQQNITFMKIQVKKIRDQNLGSRKQNSLNTILRRKFRCINHICCRPRPGGLTKII